MPEYGFTVVPPNDSPAQAFLRKLLGEWRIEGHTDENPIHVDDEGNLIFSVRVPLQEWNRIMDDLNAWIKTDD